MSQGLKVLASIAATLTLTGCCCICQGGCCFSASQATRTIVVVVPARSDGHIGTVVINPGPSQTVLNTAYASAMIESGSEPVAYTSTVLDVESVFAEARRAQPEPPITYTAYFILGTDELNPESLEVLNRVVSEVQRRASGEITVIGHTDRVGAEENNDTLSQQRAERVRDQLIRLGVQQEFIYVTGRGERAPVEATEDDVPEPRNRRVEISVR